MSDPLRREVWCGSVLVGYANISAYIYLELIYYLVVRVLTLDIIIYRVFIKRYAESFYR